MALSSLALTLAALTACGPTQSTILINEAEVALQKAEMVDAINQAPYEYYSSKEYIHKAKEEWGYSDFEASLDYATLARKFAEEALKKAKGSTDPRQRAPEAVPSTPGADPEADSLENKY
jgi:hypothetical protein